MPIYHMVFDVADQRANGSWQKVEKVDGLRGLLVQSGDRRHPDHQKGTASDTEAGQYAADQTNGCRNPWIVQDHSRRKPPHKITSANARLRNWTVTERNKIPASSPPARPPSR